MIDEIRKLLDDYVAWLRDKTTFVKLLGSYPSFVQ
jgi:hypothetical protein